MKKAEKIDIYGALFVLALLLAGTYTALSRGCDLYGKCELASGALWHLINPLLL